MHANRPTVYCMLGHQEIMTMMLPVGVWGSMWEWLVRVLTFKSSTACGFIRESFGNNIIAREPDGDISLHLQLCNARKSLAWVNCPTHWLMMVFPPMAVRLLQPVLTNFARHQVGLPSMISWHLLLTLRLSLFPQVQSSFLQSHQLTRNLPRRMLWEWKNSTLTRVTMQGYWIRVGGSHVSRI